MEGTPLFARWTTDFDCGYETNWWYTIQDKPLDIMGLKAKHRWEINKGLKNFDCKRINPKEYAAEMAEVTLKDWETYPKSYRPHASKDELISEYKNWTYITYGAIDKEDGQLSAFLGIADCESYFSMAQGKSIPEKQKKCVNAALIYTYTTDIGREYVNGKYLSNGQRNLTHQTNFNENLCRHYGFRKAYCKLHVKYRFPVGIIVKLLFPFRKILEKHDNSWRIHSINAVLKMEEIRRGQ